MSALRIFGSRFSPRSNHLALYFVENDDQQLKRWII
jgi:hypothetical protein